MFFSEGGAASFCIMLRNDGFEIGEQRLLMSVEHSSRLTSVVNLEF
jgi:hypothetical protein